MRLVLFAALCVSATFGALDASAASKRRQVRLDVRSVHPVVQADRKQIEHIRIALEGFELLSDEPRPPLNVALVIDRSGSMRGPKLERAKEAASEAIERLQDQDIVSVVLYDTQVEVLVPATKATDRQSILDAIRGITAGSKTALFAGVTKGAAEVRKFLDEERINRVILLSDGLANIGPQSPQELEGLGQSLMKEGITVSTLGLGLGYNEDLMVGLAKVGGGNHAFIEDASQLAGVFRQEFDGLMSVVATDFEIEVTIDEQTRPVRMIGSDADIDGQVVRIPLAQLYSEQKRYFVLEVELDPGQDGTTRPLADVRVAYRNMATETRDTLQTSIETRFEEDAKIVEDKTDLEVLASCSLLITNERNCQATALRDAGQIDAAKQLLLTNSAELSQLSFQCAEAGMADAAEELKAAEKINEFQSGKIAEAGDWIRTRKSMRAVQNQLEQQQVYSGEIK